MPFSLGYSPSHIAFEVLGRFWSLAAMSACVTSPARSDNVANPTCSTILSSDEMFRGASEGHCMPFLQPVTATEIGKVAQPYGALAVVAAALLTEVRACALLDQGVAHRWLLHHGFREAFPYGGGLGTR